MNMRDNNMKSLRLPAAVLFLILMLSGCEVYIGSGVLTTVRYDVGGFTSVKAGSAVDMSITRGDGYSVSIVCDENLAARLDVRVVNGMLICDLKPGIGYSGTFKASVIMPKLDEIRGTGSSDIDIRGFSNSGDFKISLSGASDAYVNLENSEDIDINVSGASTLVLKSKTADDLNIVCSGASKVDSVGCSSDDVRVAVSGASTVYVSLRGYLTGYLNGASKLYYKGSPFIINVSRGITEKIYKLY